MKDCKQLGEYRTAGVMMIGISCVTIVVLIVFTGTLIYRRNRRYKKITETPRPSCYLETEKMNIIEMDIVNSNLGGDDPINANDCLMEDFDESVEVVQTKETARRNKSDIFCINNKQVRNGL